MNKKIKVFLDDQRIPSNIYGDGANDEWILVATVEEVCGLLKQGNVSHLSLDNDLGLNHKEGHTVIYWMMDNDCWPSEELYAHSANPYWRANMESDIRRYYYGCVKPQMMREQNETNKQL